MNSYPDYEKMRRVEAERDELRHERDELLDVLERVRDMTYVVVRDMTYCD